MSESEADRTSMTSIEVFARNSLHSIRSQSQQSFFIREALDAQIDDRNWSWSFLRKRFRVQQLETLYDRYQQRLYHAYFTVFCLYEIAMVIVYSVLLIITNWDSLLDVTDDLVAQIFLFITSVTLLITFRDERTFQRHPRYQIVAAVVVILVTVVADSGLAVYMFSEESKNVRTTFVLLDIMCVYVFLPFPRKYQCVLGGTFISLVHLILTGGFLYSQYDIPQIWQRVLADVVLCFCTNMVGLYNRFMSEITIRRAFLDRRACIESTIKLNYEKEQEEKLLLSILPQHIACKVKTDIRSALSSVVDNKLVPSPPFSDLYVEKHQDVSILYADIVNFTSLTTTLTVSDLVEMLNELFGKFDEAAEKHSCLRIKILGDCYYCVAGMPVQTQNHAKHCVEMGLSMIDIISRIRDDRNIDVDMRIGVHSGKVLSGLMGIRKWQFDIWSIDTIIANIMEQTGKPGCVHITKQTKECLDDSEFKFHPIYAQNQDRFLQEKNIETFIVTKKPKVHSNNVHFGALLTVPNGKPNGSYRSHETRRGSAVGPVSQKVQDFRNRKSPSPDMTASLQRRRTVLMDNSLSKYHKMLNKANEDMLAAIDSMPLGKKKQWCQPEGINPLFLTFDDLHWEWPFQNQPDPLFKCSVACSLFVLLCMGLMQALMLPKSIALWIAYGTGMTIGVLLLPCVWVSYIWNRKKDPHREMDSIPLPTNRLLRFLYNLSRTFMMSWLSRAIVFVLLSLVISACAIIDVIECSPTSGSNTTLEYSTTTNKAVVFDTDNTKCLAPWYFTYSCVLAMMASYTFFRIHFLVKFVFAFMYLIGFSIIIAFYHDTVFVNSKTIMGLTSVTAHIYYLFAALAIFHAMDRQMEYIARLDFRWKTQLMTEEREAKTTKIVNKMLLENILPSHVAAMYLSKDRVTESLYHEQYRAVAVMFASIPNFKDIYTETVINKGDGLICLRELNKIICEFDKLLYIPRYARIEKIKVVGSTYMAATGLMPGRKNSESSCESEEDELLQAGNNITTMVRFAANMMQALRNSCNANLFKLRIGIACGPVLAGVVGAQKPLYDIWGNTVNMASRMDSTGEAARIQVTEESFQLLSAEGISCQQRGTVFVKGRGLLTTYFVNLTENCDPVEISESTQL